MASQKAAEKCFRSVLQEPSQHPQDANWSHWWRKPKYHGALYTLPVLVTHQALPHGVTFDLYCPRDCDWDTQREIKFVSLLLSWECLYFALVLSTDPLAAMSLSACQHRVPAPDRVSVSGTCQSLVYSAWLFFSKLFMTATWEGLWPPYCLQYSWGPSLSTGSHVGQTSLELPT